MSHNETEMAEVNAKLERLKNLLQDELCIGKSKKEMDFRDAYPILEEHLNNKISQRIVLEKFNAAYGHKLHPPGFRKLLNQERKRREETGDTLICRTCGQKVDVCDREDQHENRREEAL